MLLYLPCLATTSAIRRETGSWKWMFFSIGYSTSAIGEDCSVSSERDKGGASI